MAKRTRYAPFAKALRRSWVALTRQALKAGARGPVVALAPKLAPKPAPKSAPKPAQRRPAATGGDWLAGVAPGPGGLRRYRLVRPPGLERGERVPLLVLLHGCGQDAAALARSTRMSRVAAREGFAVLYPEQDRVANLHGCWNWFDTDTGRAAAEAASILRAIDQACLLYPLDRERVALAGISAGASMAALLATLHPERFKAVAMHSGVPPGAAHSTLSALRAMRGRRPILASASMPGAVTAGAAWPPLLVIHGDRDTVVSPHNAQAAAQAWAAAAGARALPPREVQRGKRYPATVSDFKCGTRTVATMVLVHGLGHAWSGGAARVPYSDARGPDASRMVWAFVAKQFAALQTSDSAAAA